MAQNDELASFQKSPACAKLKVVVDNYEEDAESAVVTSAEGILGICDQDGYSYERVFRLKEIGALPTNRDKEGCSFYRAHSRASTIVKIGCSKSILEKNAVATEDDPRTRYIAKYTASLQHKDDRYARYSEKEVQIGNLGATHANHGLACIQDEVPCSIENISENGRMSKLKCFKDPVIKDIIENGFNVRVLRWVVCATFPEIAHIVSESPNTMEQVAEGETWYQNLLGITDEAKKYGNKKIMWEDVQKVILHEHERMPRMEDIPSMIEFCKKYAGLPTGVFVEDLVELVKAYVPSSRIVAGSFFDWLNVLKFPNNEAPAHVMGAVVFAHACV